ncbi:MAG: DUF4349 domain-containing protein [candidate division Zixibacteria bacterium]|jgi:hypothetical protein|nr:DUF4349 domain-containing protein [candidate division Zixibacteria bacterium]
MRSLVNPIALICILGLGCASAPPPNDSYGAEDPAILLGGVAVMAQRDVIAQDGDLERRNDRLVTSDVEFDLKTTLPDSVHKNIVGRAVALGGYVLESSVRATTIRVPSDSLSLAMEYIGTLGEVLKRQMKGHDVTDEYIDLETRLTNAEMTRERYLALLEKAESIPEMLSLERELERINGVIEGLKGRLQQLSNRIAYASVTVRTTEGVRPGPVGWVFGQLYKGVKWLFVRN